MTAKNFGDQSGAAREVMFQLFVFGPCYDGGLASKTGRDELVDQGLAFRTHGWQSLTAAGVEMAIAADVKDWHDQRWRKKQIG